MTEKDREKKMQTSWDSNKGLPSG